MTLKVYTLSNCDTCRAATKWLRAKAIAFEEHAIRETPPSVAELRKALAAYEGDRRRLFNTAGREYRAQKLGDTLPTMTDTAALELLASNGHLVKRPLVVGGSVALVGFDEEIWAKALRK